ncbi:hypothetical protein [Bradyrhizobium tunisiense]|uniref:hypothetical protein n=1 Tax=Bradyrhizobium tunisiense TaxID=3278709 RepID=UPI0035DDDDB2
MTAAHRHADHHCGGIITVIITLSTSIAMAHRHCWQPSGCWCRRTIKIDCDHRKTAYATYGEIFAALMFGCRLGR